MPLPLLNFIISPQKRLIRVIFLIVGIFLVGLGFLTSMDTSSVQKTLWVIDNSLSMAVADIKTASGVMISRLDVAKKLMQHEMPVIGGEHAIMSAAHGARLELPMTSDVLAFSNVTTGINTILRGGGSSMLTPLELIRLIYGNTNRLHIFWITDGEFTDSGSLISKLANGATFTFIGVGTRLGGPILLGYDFEGRPRYKESEGIRVNSSRNDTILALLSDSLGSKWLTLESDTLPNREVFTTNSVTSPLGIPAWTILGVCSILIGLMFSRFQYTLNYSHGK